MVLLAREGLSWGCCAKLGRSDQNEDKDCTPNGAPRGSQGSL
jgi:hypothetical protein